MAADKENGGKVKNTVEAIEKLAKAVPVYQDLMQPAAKELSKGLETVAKTINIALAPVSALVWGYDQIKDFISTRVAEKLKSVPPDRIKPPKPHVAGPALEALRYTGHQQDLRELYANLLATSLDSDTADKAHPAFVDIIKNMAPDEARMMRAFASHRDFPLVDVHWHDKGKAEYQVLVRNFSFICKYAGCEHKNLSANYIDNLCRLGLTHIPEGTHLSEEDMYEQLENSPKLELLIKQKKENPEIEIEYKRKLVTLTTLGMQFCRACVIDKETQTER